MISCLLSQLSISDLLSKRLGCHWRRILFVLPVESPSWQKSPFSFSRGCLERFSHSFSSNIPSKTSNGLRYTLITVWRVWTPVDRGSHAPRESLTTRMSGRDTETSQGWDLHTTSHGPNRRPGHSRDSPVPILHIVSVNWSVTKWPTLKQVTPLW